jgi:hypothetical protein
MEGYPMRVFSMLMSGALYLPVTLVAAQAPQMNTVYQCQPPYSIKILSCTGNQPTDTCDTQSFRLGQPFMRGKSTYAQVMTLLPRCHVQTAADVAAARAALSGATAGAGPGGFKVGDRVRILTNGWQEGTVTAIHGTFYLVRMDVGIEVSKMWPTEVRRIGKLTAEDHAAGQYDAHDRVQALFNGKWTEGEVLGQQGNMYSVKLPGVVTSTDFGVEDTIYITPDKIRMSPRAGP